VVAEPFVDFDVDRLLNALDQQRRSRGLSWRGATDEINALFADVPNARGISVSTLTGMRAKGAVEGDGVLQMLVWLDRTPDSFVPDHRPGDDTALPIRPRPTHTPVQAAAPRIDTSCALRCRTNRSTNSMATMKATNAAHAGAPTLID